VKLYPLVFSFRDLIGGNGFVAAVSMDGRVLLAEEDDDTWMFGVQPGGVAGGDRQRDVAFTEFKRNYLSVLFDIAAEAESFDAFSARINEFFAEVNVPNSDDWNAALAEVRRTNTNPSLPDLSTVKAESSPPKLVVEQVAPDKVKPNVNEFDQICEAA